MRPSGQETLFALDCGAMNWRLYRAGYGIDGNSSQLIEEPKPSPLTSFVDRKLPAAILLTPEGDAVESFGEVAKGQLENEAVRRRIREYFKPCIGVHLEKAPLPHQKRYTHAEALGYTGMLLETVIEQIREEKWRTGNFDKHVYFTFVYPVHWGSDHEGKILEEFRQLVRGCFPEEIHPQIRFVAEPEAAILSLQRQGALNRISGDEVTLITDVGGSSTDIIAGQVDPATGELGYLGRYGEPFGGGLYDAEITKFIADELQIPASALADDPSAMVSLRMVGQRLKESLSRQLLYNLDTQHISQRTVTLVMRDGKIYRSVVQLGESQFNEITHHLQEYFLSFITKALKTMGIVDGEVKQVVLVGGGAQLFSIVRHLRDRFGGKAVILADNPEESVVHGASLEYGASIAKSRPSLVFIPDPTGMNQPQEETESSPFVCSRLVTEDGRVIDIPEGVSTFGRSLTNVIQLHDEIISRTHAELNFVKGELQVTDMGSTNGTFINDERLTAKKSYPLKPGDKVSFGDKILVCEK